MPKKNMTQAEVARMFGMPTATVRDWKNKEQYKNTYRNIMIEFILSRPVAEVEEFLKSRGVDIEEFIDGRVKTYTKEY